MTVWGVVVVETKNDVVQSGFIGKYGHILLN